MCATGAQNDLQNEQMDFYKQLQTQDATEFGEFQSILPQITAAYSPILAAGPSQNGFSTAETNDLNTTADEGVATSYENASKALKENQAAEGGGDTYLPSGVNATEDESLLSSAAQQDATEKLQIKQAGYQQGNQNFQEATQALTGEQGLINPEGGGSVATGAGSAAGTTASEIASENESWEAPLIGAAGAVGAGALGAAKPPAPCWIASEIFGGWNEPRTKLVREWLMVRYTDSALLNLYIAYGEWTAGLIRRVRPLRWIFTKICNLALRRAREWKASAK